LFGLTILLGMLGGEIARRSKFLPIISGYIAVGFLVGPGGFDIVTPTLLSYARIFVDVALGLILFDLGKRLDFTWLKHDRGLLPMALAESALTFLFTFLVLMLFHLPWQSVVFAATIAVVTSPAVIMMVAHDLSSEGPVTRRTLTLTSLNNLIGLVLFTILSPLSQRSAPILTTVLHSIYHFIGAITLGLIIFYLTRTMAKLIGKRPENQFVLFTGMVVFTIGLSHIVNISYLLPIYILGVAARNLDKKYVFTEVDFGWLARIFFIILFVITGVQLQLTGLWQMPYAVLAFILIRFLSRACGIWLFARTSRLTSQQAWAISFALIPMAELAIGMSNKFLYYNPTLGHEPMLIIASAVAILNLLGPIATQLAFIKTGEALNDK
jgi:Kef-type K+ transport system membrane component KefB